MDCQLHHVGASFVSLALTFFISQSALTPLLLLFSRDPHTLGSRLMGENGSDMDCQLHQVGASFVSLAPTFY